MFIYLRPSLVTKFVYIVVSVCLLQAQHIAPQYITYSIPQMQDHKNKFITLITSKWTAQKDPSYQLKRAISTISGDDCDYIPKVPQAGEIVHELIHYQIMHNGLKVILNCYYDAPWLTDVIYGLKGHHEPQEEKCFYEVLKYIPENATMIELGSYWAYYSLWFATQIPGAKNYLIEPDDHRLEIGKKNFELNNKVGIFQRGFVGIMKDNEPNMHDTPWISIDDFIDQQKITHVNILHADIQGAESEMLTTTVRHLDHIDYFFISTHGAANHHPCLQFFKAHDFIIVAEHADMESCSGDGLIVAKRKGVAGPDHIEIRKYPRTF